VTFNGLPKYTHLKKLLFAALLLISCNTYGYNYYYPIRLYHVALNVSNPLSATFKYGGGFEHRYRNFAYMASYYKYIGAYPGAQMNLDMRVYLRPRWINTRSHFSHQNFIYWKGTFGTAGFDGPKLSALGYDSKVVLDENGYAGFGAGLGRRYQKGVFFVTATLGLKYCALGDLEQEDKNLYRLFYTTGPGSIFEVHFLFGLQL
jgi:hypothetical protein